MNVHSTQHHLHTQGARLDPARTVGRWARSPGDGTGRIAEGGLRLQGKHKRSLPDLPLVSIITVSLNAAATIGQTITSVLRQTYPNVEYIVVDGGSADGTVDIVRASAHAIDYFVSEPDGGLYAAMNKGLALATGELLLILNADDWYADDALEALVAARGYSGCDFVSALGRYVDADGRPLNVMRSLPFDAGGRLRMPLRHETMLVPGWIYDRLGGYDESYRVIADFELTVRLHDAGVSHYELPRPLLQFRNTGVSTRALDKLTAERTRLLAAQFPELAADDLTLLANMSKVGLEPESVEPLAQRYWHVPRFAEALRAYQIDQSRRTDAPAWSRLALDWAAFDRARGRPLVSILLHAFDGGGLPAATIDAALGQTLVDIELVCVVGPATAATTPAMRDERIRIVRSAEPSCPGRAINEAVRSSRGDYLVHLDVHTRLAPDALARLYAAAMRHGSDIVTGAIGIDSSPADAPAGTVDPSPDGRPLVNTTLAESRVLLRAVDLPCLTERVFAGRRTFATIGVADPRRIACVDALACARSISTVEGLLGRTAAPAARPLDLEVQWRNRAWHLLRDRGQRGVADALLLTGWEAEWLTAAGSSVPAPELRTVLASLGVLWGLTRPVASSPAEPGLVQQLMAKLLAKDLQGAMLLVSGSKHLSASGPAAARRPAPAQRPLRVATFSSMDSGGAATGSHRRIEALRERGADVTLQVLQQKGDKPYVRRITALVDGVDASDGEAVWQEVRRRAVLPAQQVKGYRSQDFFSLAASVVDFRKLRPTLDGADIVHFHWAVGMFDYEHAAELADKPVFWTLADMNAFTGGCHYSQGCDGYMRECLACPLLGGKSDLAHVSWKRKKAAYESLRRLHIICPSRWMAQRVAASSLLRGRPVHVIPNAFPIDRFAPTNKAIARMRMGLPLRRKLLLFGADTLASARKGRVWLKETINELSRRGTTNTDVVLFGSGTIDLPLPVHSLGPIDDERRLALAYSAADAFLLPSSEDNAPLTVGESLLCGTPVIAFPVGNVPDLVRDRETGYIAKHGDVADLVRGIDWAIGAEPVAAIRRSMQCRLSAAQYHNPATAAERHLTIYREALSHVQSV